MRPHTLLCQMTNRNKNTFDFIHYCCWAYGFNSNLLEKNVVTILFSFFLWNHDEVNNNNNATLCWTTRETRDFCKMYRVIFKYKIYIIYANWLFSIAFLGEHKYLLLRVKRPYCWWQTIDKTRHISCSTLSSLLLLC